MVKVCSEDLMRDSACFSEPVSIPAEEAKRLHLDELAFQETATGDVDGDGLVEDEFNTILYPEIRFHNGKFSFSHPLDEIQFGKGKKRFKERQGGVALRDVDGDGRSDLVVKDFVTNGIWVYYNLNEKVPPPDKPALIHLDGDSYPGVFGKDTGRYYEKETLNVEGVVTGLTFHPSTATYVRIDNGGLTEVVPGQSVVIANYDFPLSLDASIDVCFYNSGREQISSLHITQSEPTLLRKTSPEGIVYTVYYPPGRETFEIDLKRLYASMPSVSQRAEEMRNIWGDQVVKRALREVVLNEGSFDGNASAESSYAGSGKVFVSERMVNDYPAAVSRVVAHEAAHNIEGLFITKIGSRLLEKIYNELQKTQSPAFDFITDGTFFGGFEGGHPSDSAGELFASTTHALSAGPDAFAAALARWDATHSKAEQERLRADLGKLIDAYEVVLKKYGPKASISCLEPFKIICKSR